MIADLNYELGIAEGKLAKMEQFKEKFMPNPKNVFPDAIPQGDFK